MRMRLAPLVAAVVGLVWAAGSASASHFGASTYGCCQSPCGDSQTNFASNCANLRTRFGLVWDNAIGNRFQTQYETVQETVMKPVTRTTYTEETRTGYRTCKETAYRTEQKTVCKPVYQTVMKEC